MRKFDEWSEAQDWAKETNRSLESIGTCTGDERTLRSWNNNTTQVELMSRIAEVMAVGERNEVYLNIKEYIVVTTEHHRHGDSDIYHADDRQEAMKHFDYEVSQLKNNA